MTPITRFPQFTPMDILVTGAALVKLQSGKLNKCGLLSIFVVGSGWVAFLACDLSVLTDERESGVFMVEFLGLLPIRHGVATQTFSAQLATMSVPMATQTVTIQPQKSFFEVFSSFFQWLGTLDEVRFVAIPAGLAGVSPFQRVSSELMIEVFLTLWPEDHLEISAVVF